MEQAITPSNDPVNPMMDLDEAVEQAAVSDAELEDKELASLKSSRAWQGLAKDMQADIDDFMKGNSVKVMDDNGKQLPDDVIGRQYLLSATLAGFLHKYLDKVNGAAERVADNERKQQAKRSSTADKPV